MNYLAHLLLSGPDRDMQVGGLLGDFVKGPLRQELPPAIEFGIRLHRKIDVITDHQTQFLAAAEVIPPQWRRYRGILLDIYFDHLLATRWDDFHHQPLADFCQDFYRQLALHHSSLPPRARHFCEVAPKLQWLESYAVQDVMPAVYDNVGKRLRHPIPLGDVWPDLEKEREFLNQSFDGLMKELLDFAQHFHQSYYCQSEDDKSYRHNP